MTPLPTAGTPEPSAAEDRASVLEMMSSPQMQRRLEEARAQRERVLAERAAAQPSAPQDPRVRLAWDRELGSIEGAGAKPFPTGEAPPLPWLDEAPAPFAAAPASAAPELPARRGVLWFRGSGAVIGLVAGLALGTGLMWLAAPEAPGAKNGSEEAPAGPSALDVAPSPASTTAEASPAVSSIQAPADRPLGWETPVRQAEPEGEDGPLKVTGAAPVDTASRLPSLVAPSPEAGVQVVLLDAPTMVRPAALSGLAAAPSPDAPPLAQDVPPAPSGELVGLDWEVALHLPPGTPPEALREAQSALRDVGVGLIVSTGAARFGVARSEVRFFHGDDAADAARIAEAMGAQARDFSTYRPTPPPGSFEVWLVGEAGAQPSD